MSLRTAVVGGGTVSARHLNGLTACPHTTLVAVCDIDADRVREAASTYDVTGYTDSTTMFEDADLDWAHVCTPVGTHLDLALQAIEAGVPTLIQKPITETTAEYEELAAAAREHGVPVTPVHNHNFDPAMRRLQARVAAGDVGTVRAVDVHYTGQTFPDDVRRGEWAFELPGGEFEEGLPHPLYLLLRVGGYPATVDDVRITTHLVREYDRPFAYDGVSLNYESEAGVLCTATLLPGEVPDKTVHVYGDDGILVADMVSQTLLELDRDYEASPVARARHNVDRAVARLRGNVRNLRLVVEGWRDDDWETAIETDSLWYQLDAEARAHLGDGELPVPLAEGGWTIRLLDAIRERATESAEVRPDASVSR